MEGKFTKISIIDRVFDIVLLIWGATCLLFELFIAILSKKGYGLTPSVYSILFGLVCFALALIFILYKRGRYIKVENLHVSARCNFGRKLECDIGDADFAAFYRFGRLLINLKGKKYSVSGLENAQELASYINYCKNIRYRTRRKKWKAAMEELIPRRSKLKKRIKILAVIMAISFAAAVASFIIGDIATSYKRIHEYTAADWKHTAVAVTCIVAMMIIFAVCILIVSKTLREDCFAEQKLHNIIFYNYPLVVTDALGVYVGKLNHTRVTAAKNSAGELYYIEETPSNDYCEIDEYTSDTFPDMESLMADMTSNGREYYDISSCFKIGKTK